MGLEAWKDWAVCEFGEFGEYYFRCGTHRVLLSGASCLTKVTRLWNKDSSIKNQNKRWQSTRLQSRTTDLRAELETSELLYRTRETSEQRLQTILSQRTLHTTADKHNTELRLCTATRFSHYSILPYINFDSQRQLFLHTEPCTAISQRYRPVELPKMASIGDCQGWVFAGPPEQLVLAPTPTQTPSIAALVFLHRSETTSFKCAP